jgi:hypothetical protein
MSPMNRPISGPALSFALDAGITHAVSAPAGGTFLLTVVAVSGGAAPGAAT